MKEEDEELNRKLQILAAMVNNPSPPDKVFDSKLNSYMAVQSDDELLGRMAHRPALMISCMQGAGVGAAASALARSLFRTARELERRGYSVAMIVDHQRRILKEDEDSFMCSNAAC